MVLEIITYQWKFIIIISIIIIKLLANEYLPVLTKKNTLFRNPKVSIIIPCYNDGQFINEAINSVFNQSYQNFEIVIINDGSDDNYTNQLLKEYCNPKIKVIEIEHQGPAIARNKGIEEARGKYILPLDADDKIERTYLEKGVQLLEKNNNLGIVYCKVAFFGLKEGQWNLPEYSLDTMLLQNVIFNTAFFRKSDWEKVGGYNPNMLYGMEDYDFWLSLIELGVDIYRIPEVLFYYRVKANSRTTNLQKFNIDMFEQLFYNHQNLYIANIRVLLEKVFSSTLLGKLYINTGNGYNEKETLNHKLIPSYTNIINYNFGISSFSKIESLRFDPIENHWCKLEFLEITYERLNGNLIEIDKDQITHNGIKQKNGNILFNTFDPKCYLPCKKNIKTIFIKIKLEILGTNYIENFLKRRGD